MKGIYFAIICAFLIGCTSKKDNSSGNSSQLMQDTLPRNTVIKSQPANQNILDIIEKLKSDLGKSANTIISENPTASRPYSSLIVLGNLYGSSQYYRYYWSLKNDFVSEATYLQPYDEKSYQDAVNTYISVFGQGLDSSSEGYGWLVPEKGGITIILAIGSDDFFIHSIAIGYHDIELLGR
jgi:hypothetical protein